MGLEENALHPINCLNYLKELLGNGYSLKGPRGDSSKNLIVFIRLLNKGYEFIPEELLKDDGYDFVEPNKFTQGLKLAYKVDEENFEEYFKSNYSLIQKDVDIPLYLKKE